MKAFLDAHIWGKILTPFKHWLSKRTDWKMDRRKEKYRDLTLMVFWDPSGKKSSNTLNKVREKYYLPVYKPK